MTATIDPSEFRQALGSFATGVTIVTTCAGETPIGVTASSFNSVSLDPPLVLWSLAKGAHSREIFCTSGHFAVHVLAVGQEELSNNFAQSGADKFAGVAWTSGLLQSPILDDYATLFECKTVYQYEGGDHIILVGEVVRCDKKQADPLLFHGGQYAESRPKIAHSTDSAVDLDSGRFSDDFLFYLISRAHYQSSKPARERLAQMGLSQGEYLTLSILNINAPMSAEDTIARLEHTGLDINDSTFDTLVERRLLEKHGNTFALTSKGRDQIIEVLAISKAFEDDLVDHFTTYEIAEVKHILKKIIEITGPDVPPLWAS